MLRQRTATGSYTLSAGQTSEPLRVVSLAGQSGFSRTANVYGFATSSTSTQKAPAQSRYVQNGRLMTRAQPAPEDPDDGSRAVAVNEDEKANRAALPAGTDEKHDVGCLGGCNLLKRFKAWYKPSRVRPGE